MNRDSPLNLLCNVRQCHLPLVRNERQLVCPRAHSFDIARSGYCNLLQPQDRRSLHPGDSDAAVAARRRFLDRGFGDALAADIGAMAARSNATFPRILDAGCGEGYHLDSLQRQFGAEAHGIDISVPAIDAAARRYRQCFFIVANADRFLPYEDGSFALVTSITARMNPSEFRRVLAPDGLLLVAVPGPDDLVELREAILGEAKSIDRVERTAALFAGGFSLVHHERVRHVLHFDPAAIHDVMASSYRGLRKSQREKLDTVGDLDVTVSRDLLLFTSNRS